LLLLLVVELLELQRLAGPLVHRPLVAGSVQRVVARRVLLLRVRVVLLLQLMQVFRFQRYHDGRHGLAAAVLVRLEEHVVHDRQRHHRLLHGAAGQLVAVDGRRRVAADGRVHLVRYGYGHHYAVVVGRGRRLFDFHRLGGGCVDRGRGGRVRLRGRPDHLHLLRRLLQWPGAAERVPGHRRRAAPARLQVVQPLLPGRRRLVALRHGVAEVEMIHFR